MSGPAMMPHQQDIVDELVRQGRGTVTINQRAPAPTKPKMWRVLLVNDATTYPLFVTEVLVEAFSIPATRARDIMLAAHRTGQALVKVTTKELAETQEQSAQHMIVAAKPGHHFHSSVSFCELTFLLQPEE